MKRILTIMKVLVAQLDILETMTPLEFQSFRTRLEAASGFQSDQFRQLEFVLGQKVAGALARFPEGSRAHRALGERHQARTLWDAFIHYLSREGYAVPAELLSRDVTMPIAAVRGAAGHAHRRCIAPTPRTRSCASGWWISTKACRSGATVTSRWCSARSAPGPAPAARAAPAISPRR